MGRGVKVEGIECPIIREGDNIVDIVVDSVLHEIPKNIDCTRDPFGEITWFLNNKSIIGITESVVARAAGQYVTVDEIAADIEKKYGKDATITLVNPIYSRNRFSLILKGVARAAKKVVIAMPDYDEVGNPRKTNQFTGVNMAEYYTAVCKNENCECEITDGFYTITDNPLYCGLHDYKEWGNKLSGDVIRYTLADICSDKSPDWGLLGTNKATEEKLKLFPSKAEAQRICDEVKRQIWVKTSKDVIVCVYGDGCFKDPVGGIWEFADPVTMPAYTDKELIESTPNEYKLKYLIDNYLSDTDIYKKTLKTDKNTTEEQGTSMGTTPRKYRDLLASLMDLTSGSGDRATPVVLVQNYF